MTFFQKGTDGGQSSHVTGYWLVEIKPLFSIVLLKFAEGSRENYHSHAFNAVTWFLSGEVDEHLIDGTIKTFKQSFVPKYTSKSTFHKVYAKRTTWAVSFRGPWSKYWKEFNPSNKAFSTLTHGRKIVNEQGE